MRAVSQNGQRAFGKDIMNQISNATSANGGVLSNPLLTKTQSFNASAGLMNGGCEDYKLKSNGLQVATSF